MAASFDGEGENGWARPAHGAVQPSPSVLRELELARALEAASFGLSRTRPDLSALGGLTSAQRSGLWGAIGALTMLLIVEGAALLSAFTWVAFAIFTFVVSLRLGAAMAYRLHRKADAEWSGADSALPTLTVLVPLHDEANMAEQIVGALCAIDYPIPLTEILVLVEAGDTATLDAFFALPLPAHFRIVPIPHGEPKTKPRALNYGLALSEGEIVAVFDAEDHPHPNQAKRAIAALKNGGARVAAVQAPLKIHNGSAGWLPRQFEIEYAAHFGVWLPFLARIDAPIALGGTSNYFRRSWLMRAGGWDPWNVTEDADLGLRLARMGGSTVTISAPTLEEAPVRYIDWHKQRTRWMKGHMQTWMVLMRHPARIIADLGPWKFLLMQGAFGGSLLASCLHLPFVVWMLLGFVFPSIAMNIWQGTLFLIGYGAALAAAIATHTPGRSLVDYATLPIAWLLQSVAALRAMWELKHRPYAWAKTPHGLKTGQSAGLGTGSEKLG